MSNQANPLSKIDEAPLPARTKSDFELTKVGVHVSNVDEALTLAKAFAASGLFKDVRDASQCVAKILMGAEYGITPVAAMSGIHIVQGKMQLSGVLIGTLINRSGRYKYRVRESTNEAAAIEFFERLGDGWDSLGVERFTLDDAKRQQTQNIQKFPRNMLWNRAMSNGAKFYCPDVFGGMPVYAEGEIEEEAPASAPAPTAPSSSAERIKAAMVVQAAPSTQPTAPDPVQDPNLAVRMDEWFRGLQPTGSEIDWLEEYGQTNPDWATMLDSALEAGCRDPQQVRDFVQSGELPQDEGGLGL